MNKEEKKIIDQLDENLNEATNAETREYQEIIKHIQIQGEQELRAELDGYLEKHLGKNEKSANRYWISLAVAAAVALLVVAFNWGGNEQNANDPMQLQINQQPVHADSATWAKDSLQQKKTTEDVDTLSKGGI